MYSSFVAVVCTLMLCLPSAFSQEIPPDGLVRGVTAEVIASIKQSGSEPITIDYSMQRAGPDWKVYDITVVGVSLVLTYRDTFATEVRNGGVDGLVKTLARKNRELSVASG